MSATTHDDDTPSQHVKSLGMPGRLIDLVPTRGDFRGDQGLDHLLIGHLDPNVP